MVRGACAFLLRSRRLESALYCLPAAMAGALKKTTGLVGLAVAENPHEHLRILYSKILTVLQDIPKDAAYRKYTEQIVNERFNMVKTEPNVQKLEDKMKSGQIEEVIIQAESELSLARKMAQWKPWEPLVEEPPTDQWRWPI
ncbi:NADH dehydrogenase [ubiquinone] 1 alpha subcomplex subunit 5 [Chelonoidis abingdonii]|uniref:NADH dehydrogenase [ubiquinone] 1 alpha subcomplex subunit 5 n=1 Tax=Chelonoidis abingdonii TaxID=106734 RepID=A0A8C0GI77_CHEAB|nr:NADH dehydrogenase [ubiquinone] 1 alpha subcomplex subunit 5 [Chelonoidis abingdonii]